MKIGYLLQQGFALGPEASNGPANHVTMLVEHLERLGHQVRVVMGLDGSVHIGERRSGAIQWEPSGAKLNPSLAERGVRRIQRELGLPYLNLFQSLRFARASREACRDVDVFLERSSWTGYGGGWLAGSLGKPLILEYNGDPLHDLEAKGMAPGGLQRWVSILLMRRMYGRATQIVASGEGWRHQLINRWRVPAAKVVTIQNGTCLLEILSKSDLCCFDKNKDADSVVRFVYLGGFQPWQGVETLLGAFDSVRKELPSSELTLIGDGPGIGRARDLAATFGLNVSVQFTGALSPKDYAPLLARADIGLSPYCGWAEYEGLKIFDYKAAGLAIIASGENEQPESVTSGPVGRIVPPCDGGKLAEAMIELGSRMELRQEMGRRARLEAETCHGWDHTARSMDEVLRAVLPDNSLSHT